MTRDSADLDLRLIDEPDVEAVAQLYRDVYGDDYPFKQFYDSEWIKRGVFDSEIRWYVAEHDGRLLGSGAVMLNAGDADDLVSEIGRLVVHPDARGLGLGTKLVQALTDRADELSDFAFAECRTAHVGSQIIFERLGYYTIGIEPLVYELDGHETCVYVCRLSETGRFLRRSNPVVIPEVYELASLALTNCGLDVDVAVAPAPAPYPVARGGGSGLTLKPMPSRQLFRLLKLSREHFLNPEVFGAFRLEYGHLKLVAHEARYLVLRDGDTILGGLGYTFDDVDRKIDVFELVASDERARGTLIERGIQYIETEHDPRYLGIDVNAHSTRIQQSLSLLGFAPVVYAPSMVYVMGERFDVVKMVKLRQEPKLSHWKLIDSALRAAQLAEEALLAASRGVSVDRITRRVGVFDGLTDLQIGEVGALCHERSYEEGETVFREGSADQALFAVLEGAIDIVRATGPDESGGRETVITVEAGEIFGEMALLEELPRSAGATARVDSRLLVMRPEDFDALADRDPEAALIIVRNIATVLSGRLRNEDEATIIAGARRRLAE